MAVAKAQMARGGRIRPPWPFCINSDSPQAQGLVSWWPLGQYGGSGGDVDIRNRNTMLAVGGVKSVADGQMRYGKDFDGASYLYNDSPVDIAYPYTFTTWSKRRAAGVTHPLYCYTFMGGNNDVDWLYWNSSNFLLGETVRGAGFITITSTTTVGAEVLAHAGFAIAGVANRAIYINGKQEGSSVTSVTPVSQNSLRIGVYSRLSGNIAVNNGQQFDARLYNRALSTSEFADWFSDPSLSLDLYYELGRRAYFLPDLKQTVIPSGIATAEVIGTPNVTDLALVGSGAIRHTKRRLSQPPSMPFVMNEDSPQAQGLVAWYPLGVHGGAGDETDFCRGQYPMEAVAAPPSSAGHQRWRTARSFNGTTQYVKNDSLILDYPLTFAVAFNKTALAADKTLMTIGNATDNSSFHLTMNTAGNVAAYARASTGGSVGTFTTGGCLAGTWNHACGVYVTSSNRRSFLNGGNQGLNAGSAIVTGMTRTAIGVWYISTIQQFFDGLLADARIYNRALSDQEVATYFSDPSQSYDLYYELRKRIYWLPDNPTNAQNIGPLAITSAEALGTPNLAFRQTVLPSAIASVESIPTPVLNVLGGVAGSGGSPWSKPRRAIHRPRWPFTINWDSPQAKGLVSWWPLGIFGTKVEDIDLVGARATSHVASPIADTDQEFRYARRFNGTSQYLTIADPAITVAGGPMTMAIWFNRDTLTSDRTLMGNFAVGSTTPHLSLRSLNAGSVTVNAGGFVNTASVQHTALSWNHACGVMAATNSRAIFLNGGNKGNGSANSTQAADRGSIGVHYGSSLSQYFNGLLADARVYDRALSEDEIAEWFSDPRQSLDLYYELGKRLYWLAPQNVPQTVTPTGIASVEAIGTPTVILLSQFITPTGIASAYASGSHTVTTLRTILPTGIASGYASGSHTVTTQFTVSPTSISSAEAFGTANVANRQIVITTGIATGYASGSHTILKVNRILTTGIVSAEAFGAHSIITQQFITVTGIASAQAFGSHSVSRITLLTPQAIVSAEAFGTAKLNLRLYLAGIVSAEAFGAASLSRRIFANSILTGETFGTPSLRLTLRMVGITSAEAFGLARLNLRLYVTGITSVEAFGVPTLIFRQNVYPVGIASAEAFGVAFVLQLIGGPYCFGPLVAYVASDHSIAYTMLDVSVVYISESLSIVGECHDER